MGFIFIQEIVRLYLDHQCEGALHLIVSSRDDDGGEVVSRITFALPLVIKRLHL